MNHTYSVLFWINRAKVNKSGQVPIYARVTVSGKRAEIATGRYIESGYRHRKHLEESKESLSGPLYICQGRNISANTSFG
jgi:hypothetical protein